MSSLPDLDSFSAFCHPQKGNKLDRLLSFFSDLILFTAGLAVIVFWLVLIVLIGIEIWDAIFEKDGSEPEGEDDF